MICNFIEVIPSVDGMAAFKDVDVAMLVGAMPRREGMERKDLLAANVKIFKAMGAAIDSQAKKTIKVSMAMLKQEWIYLQAIKRGEKYFTVLKYFSLD